MQPGISVIICCYNSALRLPPTLEHIALQVVPRNIAWEVIVVDNNSTDETAITAANEWNKYGLNVSFRVVPEPAPGLSNARKKGTQEAKFELLVFCDDDNWLDPHYLRQAYEIMCENQNIAVLGGRSKGFFETEKPSWFDRFEKAYAIGKPFHTSGIANQRQFIAGAGMVTRKSLLELLDQLTFRPLLTGRKGMQLTSGEDSELCLVFMFIGYDLYYDDRLQFIHYMPNRRLSWKYCLSMISEGHAIPQVYFDFYRLLYRMALSNKRITFTAAYNLIRRKTFKRLLRCCWPVQYFINNVVIRKMGSKQVIEFKSALNKFKFIIRSRYLLEKDFYQIEKFVYQLKKNYYLKYRQI